MRISLVVPTLNERGSIELLLRGIAEAWTQLPSGTALEVLIVDDGSTDGTATAARSVALPFPVRVIERQERGLATAVLRGFREATGEVLGVMDADLSHPTEVLPLLVEALERADLVVASRHALGGAVEEWPWYRKFASWFATQLARPLGIVTSDPMSGYFLLKRSVVEGAVCSPLGYKILLEILVKGQYRALTEIPYTFRNRDVGKSKMGWRESLNYLRHLLRLYYWRFGHKHSS
ncbi:MAG: polyprenol monophosphomannose synthase [Patescibacteria group bacterium]